MDLFVGYQLRRDRRFLETILQLRENITEVYFSWDRSPSGRSAVGLGQDFLPWEAAVRQQEDLREIAEAGIGLNLLLNANCYGADSLSRHFFQSTGDLTDYLIRELHLTSVTTTSPVIARFIKENFPGLEVRASVNMEIGTVEGLEYLAGVFDGFYLKRELNLHLEAIRHLHDWCAKHGKRLFLLANSGCLNYCSARQFHDNLVAHEQEISTRDNAFVFHSLCGTYLSDQSHRERILQLSNWVRPEDLDQYKGLVDGVKLATRIAPHPEEILLAYASRRYAGNLLELMEPNHAELFFPIVLNNRAFPPDYFDMRHSCSRQCGDCGYCRRVFEQAAERIPEMPVDSNY